MMVRMLNALPCCRIQCLELIVCLFFVCLFWFGFCLFVVVVFFFFFVVTTVLNLLGIPL